jgi:hypothetical protein
MHVAVVTKRLTSGERVVVEGQYGLTQIARIRLSSGPEPRGAS